MLEHAHISLVTANVQFSNPYPQVFPSAVLVDFANQLLALRILELIKNIIPNLWWEDVVNEAKQLCIPKMMNGMQEGLIGNAQVKQMYVLKNHIEAEYMPQSLLK